MATVTAFTAARMLAIESNSVVDGSIVGNNLILSRQGGGTIDAGNVRGPQGIQGPIGEVSSAQLASAVATLNTSIGAVLSVLTTTQRDALTGGALFRGRTIINSTTGGVEVYYGATTGWRPPWNTSWGGAGFSRPTTQSTISLTAAVQDIPSLSISWICPGNRLYEVYGRLWVFATDDVKIDLASSTAGYQESTRRKVIGQDNRGNTDIDTLYEISPAAGSQLVKLRGYFPASGAGTGTGVSLDTTDAGISGLMYLKDIGPSGNAPAS